ncbi:class I SAM-dependent methyltransferase [Candidatus Pacearchaeota archaeon]|nr:class I SAM-dependent methyltransferase [Candidatus Pacearchaeota archaeon]
MKIRKANTEQIREFYQRIESFDRYLFSDKKRINNLNKIYTSNKKYFGKKILDIACGGGVLGFIVEPKGHQYTGIDINLDMINAAKKTIKKVNSKNKFILGDASSKKIKGEFNTITLLGNALCHLNTYDFIKILKNISGNVKRGSFFILDYRDVVEILFKKEWKYKMVEGKKDRKVISVTREIKDGGIIKDVFDKKTNKKIMEFTHTIWAPFIIEPIMNCFGFKLIKRKPEKEWSGWQEVYIKK